MELNIHRNVYIIWKTTIEEEELPFEIIESVEI